MRICTWCDEEVLPVEESKMISNHDCFPFHHECAFRQIVGSAGHIERRCSCFGGHEGDPPGLTRREQAKAALAKWRELHPKPGKSA